MEIKAEQYAPQEMLNLRRVPESIYEHPTHASFMLSLRIM